MPIPPKKKTEIRFDRLQQFLFETCAPSNHSRVQQQPHDSTNSSTAELSVSGGLWVADYVTLRAERTSALTTLDQTPKNAAIYGVNILITV
jgi:hypothetical protein